jgi:hypothetical protein
MPRDSIRFGAPHGATGDEAMRLRSDYRGVAAPAANGYSDLED